MRSFTQARALQLHEQPAEDCYVQAEEKSGLPASEVSLADVNQFIEDTKRKLVPIEADVKDAKRRINSAKGPRRTRKAEDCEDDDTDGSA